MSDASDRSRIASRALANLVAVIAVTAIFGLKTHMDAGRRQAEAERLAARQAAVFAYDPYFTEQP